MNHPEETENPLLVKNINDIDYYFVHTPSKISDLIKNGGKVFKDSNKLKSREAFKFLQSIIESREIKVTVSLTKESLEKLKNENQELQVQVEIPPKGNN
jgi:hypothetical protein